MSLHFKYNHEKLDYEMTMKENAVKLKKLTH